MDVDGLVRVTNRENNHREKLAKGRTIQTRQQIKTHANLRDSGRDDKLHDQERNLKHRHFQIQVCLQNKRDEGSGILPSASHATPDQSGLARSLNHHLFPGKILSSCFSFHHAAFGKVEKNAHRSTNLMLFRCLNTTKRS